MKSLFGSLSKANQFASIERNLINSVTLIFGAFLFMVFLSVDLGLDDWVEDQFDQAMLNKANYLKSQIRVADHHVEFLADERFMPEYAESDDPHFFQLWRDETTIKRSESLAQYPHVDLLKPDVQLGRDRIVDIVMPNGDMGRATLSYFVPESSDDEILPVALTIYESSIGLERLVWVVDGLLIGSFILAMMLMRYVTKNVIRRGLEPLEKLNQDLKTLHSSDQPAAGELELPEQVVEEIEPIRKELNRYIRSNRTLINNEKRITADIAHELKTPLAEMITLSEVYIRYPQDERISKTYQHDMLAIAKRMKAIVENLLLLQKTSSIAMNTEWQLLSIKNVFGQVKHDLMFKYPDIDQRLVVSSCADEFFSADRFSIETILKNLIDNALYYSPHESLVTLGWSEVDGDYQLSISNALVQSITDEQLAKLTLPLFQIDAARTSNERFGLGLSIISNICRQQGYTLSFTQPDTMTLTVSIAIPKEVPLHQHHDV
ncbi:HAMP domain-containing histidine kinase [Vibrio fluvialis]|nr:HAMP domain-containing histidine kinase [Vibrio fluvialis]MBY7877931.1 HAMP domain-containing histidine kinase [Vibrio fluvialis]